MTLNTAQKALNPDPRYWAWFQKWWDADYSWEGLAAKTTSDGEHTLQDYYDCKTENSKRITAYGKDWHPLNLPPHDLMGHESLSERQLDGVRSLAQKFFNLSEHSEIHGCVWPNGTFSPYRKFGCYFSRTDALFTEENCQPGRNFNLHIANNCYIETWLWGSGSIENSVFARDIEINASRNSSKTEALSIAYSQLPDDLKLEAYSRAGLRLIENLPNQSINLRVNRLKIKGAQTKTLNLDPEDRSTTPHYQLSFDYDLDFSPDMETKVIIHGTEGHEVADPNFSKGYKIKIIVHPKLHVTLKNLHINNLDLDQSHFRTFSALNVKFAESRRKENSHICEIENSTFCQALSWRHAFVHRLKISNSKFMKGVNLNGSCFESPVIIKGTKIYESAKFENTFFENGLTITSALVDDKTVNSLVENAKFSMSVFKAPENVYYTEQKAINFTNTIFSHSFDFTYVDISGIPVFTDARLPSNADFSNLKPNKHFKLVKSSLVLYNKNLLSEYITAFRILRQLLEKQNNMTEVHKFGRLEAIAKNRRGKTDDVSHAEILFSKAYGLFGDFGQSLTRPLLWLGAALGLSLAVQSHFALWGRGDKFCYWLSDTCRLDPGILAESFDRASVYALPPFTFFAKRNAPNPAPVDAGATLSQTTDPKLTFWQELTPHLINAGSEIFLVLHGLAATGLIFLFGLALKRRLQFK